MEVDEIYHHIRDFCKESHGSSNYDDDEYFVMGEVTDEYAPLSYLKKKIPAFNSKEGPFTNGLVYSTYEYTDRPCFRNWYEKQFQKKIPPKLLKKCFILYRPNHKIIFDSLAAVSKSYDALRQECILINNKNLPTQLGEWYAKCIFGLQHIKSSSQRGFDFHLDGKKIEVKVHWNDKTSPKGVKIKRAFIELCESCILVYVAKNFMIRDICLLDSEFILRKFSGKGHTIFLKDIDISPYFFSKSAKQFSKVTNKNALMTFASPSLAMKLDGRI